MDEKENEAASRMKGEENKKKKGRKWNAQGLFQFSPRRYVISGWEEISQAREKSRTTLIPKNPSLPKKILPRVADIELLARMESSQKPRSAAL